MQLLQQVGTSSTRRNFVLPPPLIVATHKTTQWEKPKIPKTKAKNPPVVSSGRNLPIVGPAGEAAKGSRGGGGSTPSAVAKAEPAAARRTGASAATSGKKVATPGATGRASPATTTVLSNEPLPAGEVIL